ncbi:MAG: 3-dehydroquinate synthase II [Candidatus Methanofastidiosa archaeon]|nr:3-dehydroquinate synthase II [Candidatus Methanofastidiosa archaeon]MDD4280798.1 3-dehydroquinate synthase II [Candidatus Methanofastidiosa archaeon]
MKQLIVSSESEEVRKEARFLGLPLLDEMGGLAQLTVASKDDEAAALSMAAAGDVVLRFSGQEIIPLENIIAGKAAGARVLVTVPDADKGRIALETLEIGADGVVLETDDPTEVARMAAVTTRERSIPLSEATITAVRKLGLGARACIDTCSLLAEGSGMLVGSSSQGMLLVQAEVAHNEFVAPRPFRVNAGALSLYTLAPGDRTRYLEELAAGAETLVVDRSGDARTAYVARSKIELRPLVLIEAEHAGSVAKAVLQLAETVRLVTKEGSIPVTEAQVGTRILARFQEGGRHFGMLVDKEEVVEK